MILAIGGISRSGKSTLAKDIAKHTELKTCIVEQDEYVRKESEIPTINGFIDWECPQSIDFLKFRGVVLRKSKTNDITIAVGLLVFYDPLLRQLIDQGILLMINKSTFFERKKMDHRWGHVPDWFMQHIWESYLNFGELGVSDQHMQLASEKKLSLPGIFERLNFNK